MKKVIIKVGGYGYRPDKKAAVKLITEKDGPISVSDEEAERLLALKVAVLAEDAEELIPAHLDEGQFADYSMKELQKLAKEMGLKANGSREELIERITEAEVLVTKDDDGSEADADTDADTEADEEPPVLEAADPE